MKEEKNEVSETIENSNIENITNNQENEKFVEYAAYGGFWRRLAASLLDMWPTYLYVIIIGIVAVLNNSAGTMNTISSNLMGMEWMMFVAPVILTINIAYNIYLYFKFGETIGYRIFGLKIIDQKTGELKSKGAMFWRWALKTGIIAIPFIGIAGMLTIFFMIGLSKNKQGPHDRVLETLVVIKDLKRTWLVWIINLITLVIIAAIGSGVLFMIIN